MKLLIIVGLVVIGTVAYVTFQKPFERREGEITVGDLIEQSRRNIPGTTNDGKNIKLGIPVTPAAYEGTHLVSVSEGDQGLIRKGGSEVSFKIYVPSKIPKGFVLRPTSVSHALENGVMRFWVIFSHVNGDNVFISQYSLKEYLASGGMTLEEFTKGAEAVDVAGKKAYISDTGVTTSRKYQYWHTVTVIGDGVLVRIEYAGEEKLSNADLTAIAASLVR